ncbi:MAG: orotate phosphoribosyltransferase [Bacteroidetes bacterium]|nr:orotate phosphoribosyltransferase [Bacteroidota bacterium]
MKVNAETAQNVSEYLLQIKAIKLNIVNPFTWASGLKSPIYCDNRVTLSYPKIRNYIRAQFTQIISEEFGMPNVIAGVATGAIAQGVLVAQELGLPFVYIRAAQKAHGLSNQIEGVVESGQSVVVIEDLVSTGKSSLAAVDALKKAGCNVLGMVAIFTYELEIAKENFEKAECKLITLANYDSLIKKAVDSNYISSSDIQSLIKWRENPKAWATQK